MMLIGVLRKLNAVVAMLAVILIVGCSNSEPTGSVSGKVILDGQPITAGTVCYMSEDGFAAVGEVGADGSFTLDDQLPAGSYTVSVSPPQITEAPGAADAAIPQSPIPEGYFDESTSDIVQEIKEGENTVTIDLKSSGPAGGGSGPMQVAP
jgi:hypothetical protein